MRAVMLAFLLLVANPVHAEDAPQDSTDCSSHLCFRPQGCSHCGSSLLFWIYMGRGTDVADRSSTNWELGVEAGYLTNISKHHAWGTTLFVHYWDETGNSFGARVVYRRWLSNQVGLDLAPGIVFYADEQQEPAFSGQVALDFGGVIAPMAQIDMIRMDDQVHWSLMGGVRTGSYLSIPWGVLIGIYVLGFALDPD